MTGDLLTTPPVVERRARQRPVRRPRRLRGSIGSGPTPRTSRALRSGPTHTCVRRELARWGGTIEKFIGDAVMATFGAPVADEDDAERAVLAALDVVTAVGGLGEGIEARAGVTTGEVAVTVGAVGEAMVAGEVVEASRLAAPGCRRARDRARRVRDDVGRVCHGSPSSRSASLSSEGIAGPRLLLAGRRLARCAGPRERDRPGALVPDLVGRGTELDRLAGLVASSGRGAPTPARPAAGRGGGRRDPARPRAAPRAESVSSSQPGSLGTSPPTTLEARSRHGPRSHGLRSGRRKETTRRPTSR